MLRAGALGSREQPDSLLVALQPGGHLPQRIEAVGNEGFMPALDHDVEVREHVLLGSGPVALIRCDPRECHVPSGGGKAIAHLFSDLAGALGSGLGVVVGEQTEGLRAQPVGPRVEEAVAALDDRDRRFEPTTCLLEPTACELGPRSPDQEPRDSQAPLCGRSRGLAMRSPPPSPSK